MNTDKELLIYRQAVNKTMTFYHHELEAGLRRADEQEAFIYSVWRKLLTLGWKISISMDRQFNVTFYVGENPLLPDEQKKHIDTVLREIAEIVPEDGRLFVSDIRHDYLSCAIVCHGYKAEG